MDTGISVIILVPKAIIINNSEAILFINFGIKVIKILENRLLKYIKLINDKTFRNELLKNVYIIKVFLKKTDLNDN